MRACVRAEEEEGVRGAGHGAARGEEGEEGRGEEGGATRRFGTHRALPGDVLGREEKEGALHHAAQLQVLHVRSEELQTLLLLLPLDLSVRARRARDALDERKRFVVHSEHGDVSVSAHARGWGGGRGGGASEGSERRDGGA